MATIDLPHSTGRRYAVALALALVIWTGLVGGLAYLLYARSYWLRESDEANLREWLDEARIYRKALPELVDDYFDLRERNYYPEDEASVARKREEIAEQLMRLADPTRLYQGQLPLFPDIYRLELRFPGTDWKPIAWDSPLPRPRAQLKAINELRYRILGEREPRAELVCDYRLHAYNARQREAEEAQRRLLWAIGIAAAAGLPAIGGAYVMLQRERSREMDRLHALQQAEHEARAREELDRKLLSQSLDAARAENRAAEAERSTLELKSQLFASIGIMAGSYAHNIKNLLVRPNDLLSRCLATDGIEAKQQSMLHEVRDTLGTVTDRLQQILRTVRRDPTKSELTKIDLNEIVHEMKSTWTDLAKDKWKLTIDAEKAASPLWIQTDLSNLLQALENLLFNARDATFEMRNHLREKARTDVTMSADTRRQALLDAAAWKGRITLSAGRLGGQAVIEIRDNGIGMSDDVRKRCTETHFSTKRNNALFEGHNAGMGLGLSFVTMVLEHQHARLEIESAPLAGCTMRVVFPESAAV